METLVVIVDEFDNELSTMEKMEAHIQGALHRAFSVYILNKDKTSMLLQLRADSKYHFGSLWSNACCSHPFLGESAVEAGTRRVPEELNLKCNLESVGSFIYKAKSSNGLIEHEYDHVLLGYYNAVLPQPNPDEVDDLKWELLSDLDNKLINNPEQFTPWFYNGYALVKEHLKKYQ
jgi:isopentenyl-diphosphate delta-isomerase